MRVRKIKDFPSKEIMEADEKMEKSEQAELALIIERPKVKLRSKEFKIFGPQKFLQPISYHVIYGDMAIFDHIKPDDYMEKGITSMLNFVKDVKEIIIDSSQKNGKFLVVLNNKRSK